MNPRIEPFKDGLGEVRYRVIAETASWSAACRAKLDLEAINERAFVPFDDFEGYPPKAPPVGNGPPNCDGNAQYGQEPTQVGQVIAQAAHTAAESDSECSTVGCVIPQVKDNGSD